MTLGDNLVLSADEGMVEMADVRRLPVTDRWDWQMCGACRHLDSALFFHPERERGPARTNREVRAKRICRSCPVLPECRRHALAVQEPYGVWGGLSVSERSDIIRGRTGISGGETSPVRIDGEIFPVADRRAKPARRSRLARQTGDGLWRAEGHRRGRRSG